MKIISYNVNGIRAAMNKGFVDWLKSENTDILCLQELKALPEQIETAIFEDLGYQLFWEPAEKKGYSGVAILTKVAPDRIVYGMDMPIYDREGRFIRADYGDVSVVSVYHPSGSSGDLRQAFKMQWLSDFKNYIDKLKTERKQLILCGDYNICHRPIDIHDPVRNATSSGFLPEEREWIDGFIKSGFVDTFRFLNPQPHQYSWWSYRANARKNNKGWRIDYIMISETMKDKILSASLMPQAYHSDHCPVVLELNLIK